VRLLALGLSSPLAAVALFDAGRGYCTACLPAVRRVQGTADQGHAPGHHGSPRCAHRCRARVDAPRWLTCALPGCRVPRLNPARLARCASPCCRPPGGDGLAGERVAAAPLLPSRPARLRARQAPQRRAAGDDCVRQHAVQGAAPTRRQARGLLPGRRCAPACPPPCCCAFLPGMACVPPAQVGAIHMLPRLAVRHHAGAGVGKGRQIAGEALRRCPCGPSHALDS
jgi:hypothetical protein